MCLWSLGAVAAPYVVGRTVASTLFLRRIDPSFLPYTYLGSALAAGLSAIIYAMVANKLRRDRLAILTSLLFAAGVVVLRQLVQLDPDSLVLMGSIHVYMEIIGPLCIIQFWTFAGEIFNSREAKRLFPLIAAGGVFSNILFGAFIKGAVHEIGAANLLYVVAALLLLCAFCAACLGRKLSIRLDNVASQAKARASSGALTQLSADAHRVMQSKHLLSITGILCIAAIVCSLIDYQWKISVRSGYVHSENAMAGYFGTFYLITGVFAFLIQLFLTRRLLIHFGILTVMMLLPCVMLITSLGIVTSSNTDHMLWATTAAKGCETVLRYSIHDATIQVLYLPIAARFRSRAKPLIDGTARTFCVAVAGLFILVLTQWFDVWQLSFVAMPMIVVWGVFARKSRKHYLRSLRKALDHRWVVLDNPSTRIDDSAIKVLEEALSGDDVRLATNALEMLSMLPDKRADTLLFHLLESNEESLRTKALQHLGRRGNSEFLSAVKQRLQDESYTVRAAAIEAICNIQTDGCEIFRPLLADPHPLVQRAAMVGNLRCGNEDEQRLGKQTLLTMLRSEHAPSRLLAAEAIGDLKDPRWSDSLLRLFDDEDPRVQNAAIRSAGFLGCLDLVVPLIAKLNMESVAAAEALARLGELAAGPLASKLASHDSTRRIRTSIPGILQRIGAQKCADALQAHLGDSDEQVRSQVTSAFSQMLSTQTGCKFDRDMVRKHCEAEMWRFFETIATREDLGSDAADSLIGDALDHRARAAKQSLLDLLAILHPEFDARTLSTSLASQNQTLRANAIELVDNCLTGRMRRIVLSMLENSLHEQILLGRQLIAGLKQKTRTQQLESLLKDENQWISACAIHQVGLDRLATLRDQIEEASHRNHPLIQHVSSLALKRLSAPAGIASGLRNTNMLEMMEKVLFLKSIDLLADLPGESLVPVAEITETVSFEEGEVLIRQDEPGDCLYLVVEGKLKVMVDGREVATIFESECVGELSVLDQEPRSASVIAASDVLTLKIDRDNFHALIGRHVEIAHNLIKVLTRRLRETIHAPT